MIIARYNRDIPECWRHDPLLRSDKGYTTSFYYAIALRDCPDYIKHDPTIKVDNEGNTFAMVFNKCNNIGCTLPEYWNYDPNILTNSP